MTTVRGYELGDPIGAGGFGAVYKAYQPVVDRDVAIKVILPQYANQPEFVRRFEMEAHFVARLEHPFIVPLYDYWRDPEGAYLVMRWLPRSLSRQLRDGPLTPQEAAKLVEQLTSALNAAHRSGVIHRDLKPANVLMDKDGNFYLTDFGIAKDLLEEGSEEEGKTIGSPAYISPEQALGRAVGPAADVYSFGVMLFECLTGRHPYKEATTPVEMIYKHIEEPLPRIDEVTNLQIEGLDEILLRATHKYPEERFGNMLALAKALHEVLSRQNGGTAVAGAPGGVGMDTLQATIEWVTARNPYKGLRAFEEVDAGDFFGRDALIEKVIGLLNDPGEFGRFLGIVGPSGSGKSSVVKAGVLPRIREGLRILPGSEQWFVATMTPGSFPLVKLASALESVATQATDDLMHQLTSSPRGLVWASEHMLDQSSLLLVIDQFEELFTSVESEAERDQFLRLLHTAVTAHDSTVRVLITLRADYYDRPLMSSTFGELLQARTEVVLPMSMQELEQAIVQPAASVGVSFEPSLLARIITDIQDEPGALPLLQYALTELFEQRSGSVLTLQEYTATGGVLGALANRAEKVYWALGDEQQTIARQMFIQLVTVDDDTEFTRRTASLSSLYSLHPNRQQIQEVLDRFQEFRLLTFDRDPATREPMVQVAHEAILRQWETLRQWLEDNRDTIRLQKQLFHAASEWAANRRDKSYLIGGLRLGDYEAWIEAENITLPPLERAFIDASITERDWQMQLEEERRNKELTLQRKAANRLRYLAGVLLLFLVAAGVLSAFAFDQRNNAVVAREAVETQVVIARQNEREARSLAYSANAQLALNKGDTDLAIALALAALDMDASQPVARDAIAFAGYTPGTRMVLDGHDDEVSTVAVFEDRILSSSFDGTTILWDNNTGEQIYQISAPGRMWSAVFNASGDEFIGAVEDNGLFVVHTDSGEVLERIEYSPTILGLAFAPDGQTFATADIDGAVALWDAETHQMLQSWQAHENRLRAIDYSADSRLLLTGDRANTLRVWDIETGEMMAEYVHDPGEEITFYSAVFLPDGEHVFAGTGSDVILWDFVTGALVYRVNRHNAQVFAVTVNEAGTIGLSGSEDKTIIQWDLQTGTPVHTFYGHHDHVRSVVFGEDERTMISGSYDSTVRIWDLHHGAEVRDYIGHGDAVRKSLFAPDNTILSAAMDGGVIRWNLETGEVVQTYEGHSGPVIGLDLSRDGTRMLTAATDRVIHLWNVESGEILQTYGGTVEGMGEIHFSPDEAAFAASGLEPVVYIWDMESGEIIQRLDGHGDWVYSLAFNQDGTRLATSSQDMTVLLWDLTTGEIIRRFEGHKNGVRVVRFTPDETGLVSGGMDSHIILWDIESGEMIRQFDGHAAQVTALEFMPDNRRFISAARDGALLVWDLETGRRVADLRVQNVTLWSVDVTQDSIVTGADDNRVQLWRFDDTVEAIRDWVLDNRYVRELTCSEREQFDVEPLCES